MVGPSNAEIDFLANSYISCGLFTVEYFILDSEEFSFEEPLYRDKICFVSCRERADSISSKLWKRKTTICKIKYRKEF